MNKTIEFQNILQTDYITVFVEKINTADNTLRNELVALYNKLSINLDGQNSIGEDTNPVSNITAANINMRVTGENGINFISGNSGSSASGSSIGYIKVNAEGSGVNAKFESIDVANINVTDGDLSFGSADGGSGSETGRVDVSVYGSLNVTGPTSYTVDLPSYDNLTDGKFYVNNGTQGIVVFKGNEDINLVYDLTDYIKPGSVTRMLFENACTVTLTNATLFGYAGGSDSGSGSGVAGTSFTVYEGTMIELIVIEKTDNSFVVFKK